MGVQKANSTSGEKHFLDHLVSNSVIGSTARITDEFKNYFQQFHFPGLDDLFRKLSTYAGKRSFLVFKNNKYTNIRTENIAYFYIRYESPMIMCFDTQEYFVNYSLEQIQTLLPNDQFYRLNRQYLINFD